VIFCTESRRVYVASNLRKVSTVDPFSLNLNILYTFCIYSVILVTTVSCDVLLVETYASPFGIKRVLELLRVFSKTLCISFKIKTLQV